jgi:glycosyltransferase involved in cell wall biosynthesis
MDKINDLLEYKNYFAAERRLTGNPTPLQEAKPPRCIFYNAMDISTPEFSIVMPIYNQSEIIVGNLESILDHTKGTYEIILIIDACSDASEDKVLLWAASKTLSSSFIRIIIIKSETPLFECAANNVGFTAARGKYLLEIQADMKMTEPGYNLLLRRPFEVLRNVIGVSGRCSHGLKNGTATGRHGVNIEKPYDASLSNQIFYVNETCNRGPLLLCHQKVKALGYLDEQNFYLDNSDHDLFARAWADKKWICGYVPIHFDSPIAEGSTRKPRDPLNTRFLSLRRERSNGGFLAEFLHHGETRMPSFLSLK